MAVDPESASVPTGSICGELFMSAYSKKFFDTDGHGYREIGKCNDSTLPALIQFVQLPSPSVAQDFSPKKNRGTHLCAPRLSNGFPSLYLRTGDSVGACQFGTT